MVENRENRRFPFFASWACIFALETSETIARSTPPRSRRILVCNAASVAAEIAVIAPQPTRFEAPNGASRSFDDAYSSSR